MIDKAAFEHCRTFIDCQLEPAKAWQRLQSYPTRPAITVSRQAGCGALVVARRLAELLQRETLPQDPPWTVFDRELMDKVLEDHNLPTRLAKFLPEDRATELQDITEELFGLRPASWTMIQQTSETILKLAGLGHVILIGRGANVITAKLAHVVHVRLVAPLEARIQNCQASYNMTPKGAREFCQREDEGRRRYLKKYFHAEVNDALLYDLTINTDAIAFDAAAGLIAEATKAKMRTRNLSH